ncbi:PLP-dependent aminotransferase family protein [Dokdonella koreensis]|uniref:Transcriptional regulator, GntR family n=1 Tax=Dokdonella koreensis DS-123 TaxID=1300342 RepID=A0A160DWN4_9GAMM|nr:PLP-dependent aminotransferase family protein [Dokdonella koreensis]ANB18864.1 Transcriptional regulator, GntR family [Dokdonella koreensis DS-123]
MTAAAPRYQSLADDLGHAIRSGRLPAGAALPSLRDCAAQRALSLNTVTAAYRLLEDRGLIVARPQSGFYVRSALPEPRQSLRSAPSQAIGSAQDDLLALVLEARRQPDCLELALACPRGRSFYPGERLARLTHTVLTRQAGVASGYALPPGSLRLREQIALRGQRLGMTLAADDIELTHGATEALQLALRAVARPGDGIGIEAPAYFNLYPLLASLGLKAIEIPTHPRHGLDLDAVERLLEQRQLAALVAMPTVHNPLGCTMPPAAKQRLADLVARHGVPLIEDLVYAELQFADPPEPAVKAFDRDGWVLACSGFSKTLAPDYRVGWLAAGRFAPAVRRLKFASSGAEPLLLGEAVGLYLESGGYAHHLKHLRRLCEAQVATVRGLVADHFPAGTCATQPTGGFLLWIELPAAVDSAALFQAALRERIVILPGRVYSKGTRYRHCIRLSCGQAIDTRFVAAMRTLGRIAHGLARRRPVKQAGARQRRRGTDQA